MNTYTWTAEDSTGAIISGEIQAKTLVLAKATLNNKNVKLIKLNIKKERKYFFKKKFNHKKALTFYKNISNLITANIPLSNTTEILQKYSRDKQLEKTVDKIQKTILSGSTFYKAIQQQPDLSHNVTDSILNTAETSGNLKDGLNQIVNYLEKIQNLKQKIKKALAYPCILLTVCSLLFLFMTLFIIPEFEKLFMANNTPLPYSTKLLLGLSHNIKNNTYIIIILLFFLFAPFNLLKKYNRNKLDFLLLKIFYIGKLKKYFINSNIFRSMNISCASGVDIVSSIKSTINITNNTVYKNVLYDIINKTQSGSPLHKSLENYGLFSPIDIQLIMIAEHTGDYEKAFDQIATLYENKIDDMIARFSSIAEPIIMLVLGVLVGGFVLVMYLPMFKLGSVF